MRNQVLTFIGIAILIIGLISLADAIFNIDIGRFICPTVLILLGVWLLVRPTMIGPETSLSTRLLGDTARSGTWTVAKEEIWNIVGDVRLDLSQADIPSGETTIRLFGLVGEVRVIVPQGVGIAVSSTSFLTELRAFAKKEQHFFTSHSFTSDGYDSANRQVRLEIGYLVADVKLRRSEPNAA